MKPLLKLFVFVFSSLVTFCASDFRNNKDGIENFDISIDDKQLIFCFYKSGQGSLYTCNLEGQNLKPFVATEVGYTFANPRYSPDGKVILFIKHKINDLFNSVLCVANIDGTNIRQLTGTNGLITEAVFSNDSKNILFCRGEKFNNNSPLAPKAIHNFDIYSIGLMNRKVQKISDFSAYSITNISEITSNYVLFYLEEGEKSGIYAFEKTTPSILKKIFPNNNPRGDESLYGIPAYKSKTGTLIFSAPYELYSMNLDDRVAKLFYDSKGQSQITSIRLFNNRNAILLKREIASTALREVNLVDGAYRDIYINIPQ